MHFEQFDVSPRVEWGDGGITDILLQKSSWKFFFDKDFVEVQRTNYILGHCLTQTVVFKQAGFYCILSILSLILQKQKVYKTSPSARSIN